MPFIEGDRLIALSLFYGSANLPVWTADSAKKGKKRERGQTSHSRRHCRVEYTLLIVNSIKVIFFHNMTQGVPKGGLHQRTSYFEL